MDGTGKVSDDIAAMIERFEDFYNLYDRLAGWLKADMPQEKQDYIERQRKIWFERLREVDFPVAFLGSFSAGKSTIINAIMGRSILPESTGSTTAVPTIVRKGPEDLAKIHYVSESTKNETRDVLLREVTAALGVDFRFEADEQKCLADLSYQVDARRAQGKFDNTSFRYLEYFVKNYKRFLDKVEAIRLTDLGAFVENKDEIIFIDRIEVFLKDIDIPADVALVDLPGLGVLNKRHDRITKEYVETKAKAFVVCMKVKHLLEGEEFQFLKDLYVKDRSILGRAFWVINQWDTLTETQRKDEERVFATKIGKNFEVSSGRDFRVSALKHLILTLLKQQQPIAERYLQHMQSKVAEDEKKNLQANQDVARFDAFRDALFRYLNTTAKSEFLQNARAELASMIRMTSEALGGLRRTYPNAANATESFLTAQTIHERDKYYRALQQEIDTFVAEVKGREDPFCHWSEQQRTELCQIISDMLNVDKSRLLSDLSRGMDIEFNASALPAEISKRLRVGEALRRKVMEVVEASFYVRLERLNRDLCEVNRDYLPNDLAVELDDKLGQRDLRQRIYGLVDVLMQHYNDEIKQIGAQTLSSNDSARSKKDQIEAALDLYQTRLSDFLRELEFETFINLSIRNHAEALFETLQTIIGKHDHAISTAIGDHLRTSDFLQSRMSERERVRAAIDAFDDFARGGMTQRQDSAGTNDGMAEETASATAA
jgi:Dynamin family.